MSVPLHGQSIADFKSDDCNMCLDFVVVSEAAQERLVAVLQYPFNLCCYA